MESVRSLLYAVTGIFSRTISSIKTLFIDFVLTERKGEQLRIYIEKAGLIDSNDFDIHTYVIKVSILIIIIISRMYMLQ